MADKPILFSGPMVRAILDGRKTQTRRVIPQPFADGYIGGEVDCTFVPAPASNQSAYFRFGAAAVGGGAVRTEIQEPRFVTGDRLYVREEYSFDHSWTGVTPRDVIACSPVHYWADGNPQRGDWTKPKPGMHMPRWASRLTLTVTDVRVQRLQDIRGDDCRAEGCAGGHDSIPGYGFSATPLEHFHHLWDSLNAKRGFGWEANPWVCAVTFTAHQRNIDQLEAA